MVCRSRDCFYGWAGGVRSWVEGEVDGRVGRGSHLVLPFGYILTNLVIT